MRKFILDLVFRLTRNRASGSIKILELSFKEGVFLDFQYFIFITRVMVNLVLDGFQFLCVYLA